MTTDRAVIGADMACKPGKLMIQTDGEDGVAGYECAECGMALVPDADGMLTLHENSEGVIDR